MPSHALQIQSLQLGLALVEFSSVSLTTNTAIHNYHLAYTVVLTSNYTLTLQTILPHSTSHYHISDHNTTLQTILHVPHYHSSDHNITLQTIHHKLPHYHSSDHNTCTTLQTIHHKLPHSTVLQTTIPLFRQYYHKLHVHVQVPFFRSQYHSSDNTPQTTSHYHSSDHNTTLQTILPQTTSHYDGSTLPHTTTDTCTQALGSHEHLFSLVPKLTEQRDGAKTHILQGYSGVGLIHTHTELIPDGLNLRRGDLGHMMSCELMVGCSP